MAGADGAGQPTARQAHFDVVLRGYNQRQVNERVTRLEFDLKNSNRSRDGAAAQVGELTKLLNSTRAELDKIKMQLHNLASRPVDASNVTERVRIMMTLAEEEIGDIRKGALDAANATRAEAEKQAAEQRDTHQRALAEIEARRKQLEVAHQQRTAELEKQYTERRSVLEAEHQALRTKLTAEHEALVAEVRASGERVTADFDRKSADLDAHRVELDQKYKAYHDDLDKEYDGLKSTLTAEHKKVLSDARSEAERIAAESEVTRVEALQKLDDALKLKQSEAEKALSELETESLAKAEKTTSEASAKAQALLAEAESRSAALLGAAETKAVTAVREAEEKAATTVREADEKASTTVRTADEKAVALVRDAETKSTTLAREAEEKATRLQADADQRAALAAERESALRSAHDNLSTQFHAAQAAVEAADVGAEAVTRGRGTGRRGKDPAAPEAAQGQLLGELTPGVRHERSFMASGQRRVRARPFRGSRRVPR